MNMYLKGSRNVHEMRETSWSSKTDSQSIGPTQLFQISQSKRILPFPPEAYHLSLTFYVLDWLIDWVGQEAGTWLTRI